MDPFRRSLDSTYGIAKQLVDFRKAIRRDPRMEHFSDADHLAYSQYVADVAPMRAVSLALLLIGFSRLRWSGGAGGCARAGLRTVSPISRRGAGRRRSRRDWRLSISTIFLASLMTPKR